MKDTSDLRVWYREDIAHLLTGINAAWSGGNESASEFRRGFVAALVSIALAAGIAPDDVLMLRGRSDSWQK